MGNREPPREQLDDVDDAAHEARLDEPCAEPAAAPLEVPAGAPRVCRCGLCCTLTRILRG